MTANYGVFRVASKLNMGLDECMEKHTDEQIEAWLMYFNEEMNHPGSVEHYLMLVAREVALLSERVRTLFGGKPVEVKLEQFKLRFGEPLTYVPKSAKVAAVISKGVWAGRVGGVTERKVPKSEGLRRVNETAEEYQRFLEKMEEFRGE